MIAIQELSMPQRIIVRWVNLAHYAWHEMRPSTWQLFNGLTLPFCGLMFILEREQFRALSSYQAMREWAPFYVWATLFMVTGFVLLTSRVGSPVARGGLFFASLLWTAVASSITFAVGLIAVGPPVYTMLAVFTGRCFVRSGGVSAPHDR